MSTHFFASRIIRTALATTLFALGIATAAAEDVQVTLKGSEETPANKSTATGVGKITIGDDKSVTGSIETTGVDGTAAHIHLGAPGKSGPPIITLSKSASGVWTIPAGSILTYEQYANFKTGNLYVNVHSAEYQSGEIRGQLTP